MKRRAIIKIRALKPTESIPEKLLKGFFRETQASANYIENHSKEDAIVFGAFHGKEMVGVITGGSKGKYNPGRNKQPQKTFVQWYKRLDINLAYVLPKYRNEGINTKLTARMMAEAKKRKLKGVYFWGMEDPEISWFEKRKQEHEKRPPSKKTKNFKLIHTEAGQTHGEITLIKQKKRKKPKIRRPR